EKFDYHMNRVFQSVMNKANVDQIVKSVYREIIQRYASQTLGVFSVFPEDAQLRLQDGRLAFVFNGAAVDEYAFQRGDGPDSKFYFGGEIDFLWNGHEFKDVAHLGIARPFSSLLAEPKKNEALDEMRLILASLPIPGSLYKGEILAYLTN